MRQNLSSSNRAGARSIGAKLEMGTFVQPEMRRVSHTSKDENMSTIVKVLLLCVLCVGLITGIVYFVKWLS
jgi:hypothetical protein